MGTERPDDGEEGGYAGGLGGKAGVSRGRKGLREKVMLRGMECVVMVVVEAYMGNISVGTGSKISGTRIWSVRRASGAS